MVVTNPAGLNIIFLKYLQLLISEDQKIQLFS